jgi:hypothetical protein
MVIVVRQLLSHGKPRKGATNAAEEDGEPRNAMGDLREELGSDTM